MVGKGGDYTVHTRNIGRTAGARDGDDNACVVALAGCHRRLSRSPEGSLSDEPNS